MEERPDADTENVAKKWHGWGSEPRLEKGSPGFEFVGERPKGSERVFEKQYPDSFSNSGLGDHLKRLGTKTVIVVGAYAGRCVLATAFGAQQRGLHVVVLAGHTFAHPNNPGELEVTGEVIRSLVGYAVTPQDLLAAWAE